MKFFAYFVNVIFPPIAHPSPFSGLLFFFAFTTFSHVQFTIVSVECRFLAFFEAFPAVLQSNNVVMVALLELPPVFCDAMLSVV